MPPGDTPRPTETDEGLRWSCPRKFTDIIIGFEFDSPDMAMDFVFDRQLSDDQTCNCILTPWKGWARMRGQLVESDASETVIVFTTDIDLAYIYPPRDRWDVYHRENGEAIFFGRRPPEGGLDSASPDASRDSGYSVPLDPHAPTEATSRCDVDYQGVTATYTLRGRDLFGKVNGTPTASCEQDGTRYDIITDWFNVDVTDEDAPGRMPLRWPGRLSGAYALPRMGETVCDAPTVRARVVSAARGVIPTGHAVVDQPVHPSTGWPTRLCRAS